MDHKRLLAEIDAEDRRILLQQNDFAGVVRLAGHLGAIALLTTLIALRVPFYPVLMIIQGVLLVFLFTPLHETIHRTAFRSDWLNTVVSYLCGFLVFLPPRWFRYFHFAHHRHTQDPERDPELAFAKPETLWRYVFYLSGLPDWYGRFSALLRNAIIGNTDSFVPERGRRKVVGEARAFLAIYLVLIALSALNGWIDLLLVWLVPLLLGNPFLRGFLLAEHAGCEKVPDMLKNSRTTSTNRLVTLLSWNMPYHIEHHAYPAVPFHKLPDFHRLIHSHLGNTATGYLQFNAKYLNRIRAGKPAP